MVLHEHEVSRMSDIRKMEKTLKRLLDASREDVIYVRVTREMLE